VASKIRNVGKVTILDVFERLTHVKEGERLDLDLERILAAGNQRILINLHHVAFIDSAGLGELLALKKAALLAGAEVKLLRPREHVDSLIAEAGLQKVFECYDDEEAAIRSFET